MAPACVDRGRARPCLRTDRCGSVSTSAPRACAPWPSATTGTVLAAAARPLTSSRDGDRHEQDPHEWWAKAADALSRGGPRPARGAAASIAGVAVRRHIGHRVAHRSRRHPPHTRADVRRLAGGALAAEAQEAGDALWDRLGYRIQPAWALPKLLWWRERRRAARRRPPRPPARRDHRRGSSGDPVATDTSHALKTGYDLIGLRWPAEVLRDAATSTRTCCRPSSARRHACSARSARPRRERTGLPAGTPVVAGMTDGCAAQLAAGALAPGEWNTVLGTTLALKGVSRDAAARSDRCGVLPPRPARRPVAARRRVQHRRGRDHGAVPRRGPRRAHRARACRSARYRCAIRSPSAGSGSRSCDPTHGGSSASARCPARATVRRPGAGVRRGVPSGSPTWNGCASTCSPARAPTSAGRSASPAAGPATPGGTSCAATCSARRCASPAAPRPSVGMAVLAAGAVEGDVARRRRRMVQPRAELHPDPSRTAELARGLRRVRRRSGRPRLARARTAAHARERAAA